MDLLKKELERKRKAVQLAKRSSDVHRIETSTNTTNSGNNRGSSGKSKSYVRAADLRRFQEKQEEEERNRQKKINTSNRTKTNRDGDDDKEEHETRKRQRRDNSGSDETTSSNDTTSQMKKRQDRDLNDDTKSTKSKSSSLEKDHNNDAAEGDGDLPLDSSKEKQMTSIEITAALRDLNIPVWLFGERDDTQRRDRLRDAYETQKLKMAGISEMDEFRLGSGHGIRNPFLGSKRGKQDDDGGDVSKLGGSGGGQDVEKSGGNLQKKEEEETYDIKQHADDPHKAIHQFFKSILRQWEDDLARRPESVRRTANGKKETNTFKQCKDYIRPLFKLCKTRRLEESMTDNILKIVKFCDEGEFVKAHDAYIDVAIGRAAWPIGVTMVGIHARSGRAKISSSNVAHVMNSELQRKYLTSVKRLMSYCQKMRQDVAPSKKVTNL